MALPLNPLATSGLYRLLFMMQSAGPSGVNLYFSVARDRMEAAYDRTLRRRPTRVVPWTRIDSAARLHLRPRGLPVLGNVHQIPMQYQQNIFLSWAKRHVATFESRTMLDSYRPLQRRYVDILLADLVRDPEGFIAHLKRYAGALTIELAYGHHADIVNEEFMAFADKAMASVTEAGGVASTLVDFFPFSTWHSSLRK
ncbi:predicted protein [Postia placenta Mad-698-R]|nr:predicted protein [Postia placenta Mad-698-R]